MAARRTAKARTVTVTVLRTFNGPQAQSTRAVRHPSPDQNKGAGDRVFRPWRHGQEWPGGTEGASAMREPIKRMRPCAGLGRCRA